MIQVVPTTNIPVKVPDVLDHIKSQLENDPITFVESIEKTCMELHERGLKIGAIKLLRRFIPLGLREAKDYLELGHI